MNEISNCAPNIRAVTACLLPTGIVLCGSTATSQAAFTFPVNSPVGTAHQTYDTDVDWPMTNEKAI
jgi:hypothetical protein